MASNLKYSVALKNAKLGSTGMVAHIGTSAQLKLYNGTQPTNPDTALSGNTLLCTLTCNATQFGTVSGGVLTASAITSSTGAAGASTGTTATFYRLFKSDGTTACVDGTVGSSGCDLNFDNPNIATGQAVAVSSLTYTGAN
jgi:hypothetical protein